MADRSKQEVRIGFGQGEARVCINRWQKTSTGVKWGPNPDAPVDYAVGVLRVDDVEGKPVAVLVNYACHPSIMGADNLLYSGDYTSYVQSVVEKVYDGEVTALFSTGAGGDIKIALLNEEGSQFRYGDLEDCRRFGTMIGAEAIKVAEGIETAAVKTVSAEAMGLPGAFVVAYANSYDIGYLPSMRAEQDGWCRHDDSFKSSLQPANLSGRIEGVLVEAARKLVSTTS